MYEAAPLNRNREYLQGDAPGGWIIKEDPDLTRARILIPRKDIRASWFELEFKALMSGRYNLDNYGPVYHRIIRGLSSKTREIDPFTTDKSSGWGEASRKIALVFYEHAVLVVLRGQPARSGAHGRISSLRFNPDLAPGKQNLDGSMNWYELNKFTVVDQGEALCTLVDPGEGKYGVSIFNHAIQPATGVPYNLRIGKNIRITSWVSENGREKGQRLIAGKKGVLVLEHDGAGRLSALDVREKIRARSISFKTGNIGDRKVKIPVPVFLDEFRPDFKLYSSAQVKCSEVYGGFISTEDSAELDIVNAGSRIRAGEKIRAAFVQKSALEAREVAVTRTLIDVRVTADRFTARGEEIFTVTNADIDAVAVRMNRVLVQGDDNVIDLGRSLLRQKQAVGRESEEAALQIEDLGAKKRGLLDSIRSNLAAAVKKADPDKRAGLIQFAKTMHRVPAPDILDAFDAFKGYGNLKKIEALKKQLPRVRAINARLKEKKEAAVKAQKAYRRLCRALKNVSFRVEGFIAPGAVLKIRCDQWEAVYSTDGKTHLNLNVSGRLSDTGEMMLDKSSCVPARHPLTYPQVQSGNAHLAPA